MPRPPSVLPPILGDEPFTLAEALGVGVSRQRVRAADLHAPFVGMRVSRPPETIIDRCRAYATILAPSQAFSHHTAAALLGMPLPTRWERHPLLHVMSFGAEFPPQRRGVQGHVSQAPLALVRVDGFPVVAPERVLLQLAGSLSHRDLVRAGDHLVRREQPLSEIGRLHALAAASRGVRGVRAFRAAVERVRNGTDSPRETDTRLALVDAGLPEPVIGHRIHSSAGTYLGRPDLAYPDARIAIEYEGEYHREREQYAIDIHRRERMEDEGWIVIRVISDHLASPAAEAALARRVAGALLRHTLAESGRFVGLGVRIPTNSPDSATGYDEPS